MEAAVCQRATETLVEEEKQESDLDTFGGEAVGIALSIPFKQSMTLELTEIVTKLIQAVGLLGNSEAGQDRRVNLFGGPTADVAAAVEENLQQPDDPGLMDFDASIANRADGNGEGYALQ